MSVDELSKDAAENMAARFGFKSIKNTEKFIMNMRVHRMLSAEMDCCLRGGLCTPFYVNNPKAIRVSIDLDLFVEDTQEGAISKISKILTSKGIKAVPRKPREIKNLLQIDLKYKTPRLLHDQKEHMKIDVMCEVDFDPPMNTIPKGHKIFTGETEHDVVALTRGCLIADKIAALAINGSGYTSKDKAPKQIHDIGYLLGESSLDDLTESINVFKVITEFKTVGKEQRSAISVIEQVIEFLARQVATNGKILLRQEYMTDFHAFSQEYLSDLAAYDPDELKSNIFRVLLYAIATKKAITGELSSGNAAKAIHDGMNVADISIGEIKSGMEGQRVLFESKTGGISRTAIDVEGEGNLRVLYAIWKLDYEKSTP